MKSFLKIAIICLTPSVAFAQPDLHRGTIGYSIGSYDGDQKILGSVFGYDGDLSSFGGSYFLTENFSVGIAKTSGDLNYGATADNLTCDIDGTSISAAFHPKRVNYFTGMGEGYSIGVSSSDSDADCEDDNFYYNTITSESESVSFGVARGLGDALVVSASFSSDTDDFFDDRTIGFDLTKTFDGGFSIEFGLSVSETAEDADGDNSEFTTLSFSGGYLF